MSHPFTYASDTVTYESIIQSGDCPANRVAAAWTSFVNPHIKFEMACNDSPCIKVIVVHGGRITHSKRCINDLYFGLIFADKDSSMLSIHWQRIKQMNSDLRLNSKVANQVPGARWGHAIEYIPPCVPISGIDNTKGGIIMLGGLRDCHSEDSWVFASDLWFYDFHESQWIGPLRTASDTEQHIFRAANRYGCTLSCDGCNILVAGGSSRQEHIFILSLSDLTWSSVYIPLPSDEVVLTRHLTSKLKNTNEKDSIVISCYSSQNIIGKQERNWIRIGSSIIVENMEEQIGSMVVLNCLPFSIGVIPGYWLCFPNNLWCLRKLFDGTTHIFDHQKYSGHTSMVDAWKYISCLKNDRDNPTSSNSVSESFCTLPWHSRKVLQTDELWYPANIGNFWTQLAATFVPRSMTHGGSRLLILVSGSMNKKRFSADDDPHFIRNCGTVSHYGFVPRSSMAIAVSSGPDLMDGITFLMNSIRRFPNETFWGGLCAAIEGQHPIEDTSSTNPFKKEYFTSFGYIVFCKFFDGIHLNAKGHLIF